MREEFYWRGLRIDDIEAWARARNERMVTYHAERTIATVNGLAVESHYGQMPESMWNNLTMLHGWTYTEIERK